MKVQIPTLERRPDRFHEGAVTTPLIGPRNDQNSIFPQLLEPDH